MKKPTTVTSSHCLATGIHIHVSQILLCLVLSIHLHWEECERPQIWILVSNVCLLDWQFQYMFPASNHVVKVGYCFSSDRALVPLSQEHTTSVEILYRKKENWECVGGEHDPTDVETKQSGIFLHPAWCLCAKCQCSRHNKKFVLNMLCLHWVCLLKDSD